MIEVLELLKKGRCEKMSPGPKKSANQSSPPPPTKKTPPKKPITKKEVKQKSE
jgi:hypothetical protein